MVADLSAAFVALDEGLHAFLAPANKASAEPTSVSQSLYVFLIDVTTRIKFCGFGKHICTKQFGFDGRTFNY